MKKDDLIPLLKYYHGEENPPEEFTPVQALWWEGEKALCSRVENDVSFFNTLMEMFREAEKDKNISGILLNRKLKDKERAIIFFFDLWHGQYYPYYNLDLINDY